MLFRYIILLFIHKRKRSFINKLKKSENEQAENYTISKKILNFSLKILSSPWIVLFTPFIWLFIYESILFIIFFGFNFNCSIISFFYLDNVHNFFIFISSFLTICIIIFDFIFNIPLIFTCKWKKIFLYDDPYHFRLDMIGSLFIFIPTLIWLLVPLPRYFTIVFAEIVLFLQLYFEGIQSLVITILKKNLNLFCCQKKIKFSFNDRMNINYCLQENMIEEFKLFCQFEWSEENILFKLDCIKYKSLNSISDRKKFANIIRNKYLSPDISTLEINAPSKLMNQVSKLIDNEQFESDLFFVLEKVVDVNLSDTISRFSVSSAYRSHLKTLEIEEKSLGL